MVQIEDVTDTPEGAQDASADGVPHKRRVHFSNEVIEREAENADGEGEQPSFNERVDAARAEYQPTPMEKFMALVKSLIIRALMIYFLMTFWRSNSKPPAQTVSSGSGGAQAPASLASSNIFINGTELDMYVYISEDSKPILNFSNANLVWEQGGLVYGDWYGGPNSDGVFVHSTEVEVSKCFIQPSIQLCIASTVCFFKQNLTPISTKLKLQFLFFFFGLAFILQIFVLQSILLS